jgi:xanthine/CO dehydrogenase XdhC/CoxF family maturation factor
MKQWLETRQVFDRLAELQREGKGAALATVVRVRGSAYRHEGAKMLVAEDGATTGNVSGGCLEADVREVAMQVLVSGAPVLRQYCASADEVSAWDLGVGCEGMVEVYVELRTANSELQNARCELRTEGLVFARECLAGYVPFATCTDLVSGHHASVTANHSSGELDADVAVRARSLLGSGVSAVRAIGGHDVFIDVFTPPPQLVIVSAGDDARHLARFAAEVGFRVVVVDRRPALLSAERFPAGTRLVESTPEELGDRISLADESYVVVMTHNYADDREYTRELLQMPTPYVGMLGPRQRTERIVRELSAVGPVDSARIYGPVGLDIGTDGAEQVAVSVIGEILAVRSGRRPSSLRERPIPIHGDHRR